MGGGFSKMAKQELVATIRDRYQQASKKDKGRILDEFTAITGHHRKHGIRLLSETADNQGKQVVGRRIYDEAVREAVIVVWEASDRICGKRLKAALPNLVDSMERHGHLSPRSPCEGTSPLSQRSNPGPAAQTHQAHRRQSAKAQEKAIHGKPGPGAHLQRLELAPPGFLEIDLVAHCGGTISGSFIHSLVATDICTGWTEAVPLPAREQSLVVEGLEAIAGQLPFPVLGIDSDNDSVFINQTLMEYCADRGIEFTRSRAYRKNDQAWIEQKNGSVVRRFAGHDRYSGRIAGQTDGPPVQGGKVARELLPALIQAAGEDQGRGQGHKALQLASHAMRPGHGA